MGRTGRERVKPLNDEDDGDDVYTGPDPPGTPIGTVVNRVW